MHLGRTITACLVAVAVAMLPMAGSAVAASKASATAAHASMMASPDHPAATADLSDAMDDCCPGHAKPCDQDSDQCQSMASCPLQSLSMADVAIAQFRYLPIPGNLLPTLVDRAVPLHAGSPPFRPPRV